MTFTSCTRSPLLIGLTLRGYHAGQFVPGNSPLSEFQGDSGIRNAPTTNESCQRLPASARRRKSRYWYQPVLYGGNQEFAGLGAHRLLPNDLFDQQPGDSY